MIEPDTKDWTWVLQRSCPACGYDAAAVDRRTVGGSIRDDATGWSVVLALPGAPARRDPHVWSVLEYACHVRDVNRIMAQRLMLMLQHDEPTFADWDQDATAIEDGYDRQDPAEVGAELLAAAGAAAAAYDDIADAPEATWARRGLRSNGSEFTVDTLARYHLHDLVHHAHDVRGFAAAATVTAYDANAADFADATRGLGEHFRLRLVRFAEAVGAGGAVLEVGSGGGRDAAALEDLGLRVRRTDVSPGFVAFLRDAGHEAELLDPLVDPLDQSGDAYDGVWANASLLHVARGDLSFVLHRLADATRSGGALGLSMKEGDGERWSVHGSVSGPRHFVFWREQPLRAVLAASGWDVETLTVERSPDNEQPWLLVQAGRR